MSHTRLVRIGMTCSLMHPDPARDLYKNKRLIYADERLCHWLMSRSSLVFMLPTCSEPISPEAYLDCIDGLVLSGGADVAPQTYGETPLKPEWCGDAIRDAYELALIKVARARKMPILGVCRGLQILNVALGGSLYQDVNEVHGTDIVHRNGEIYDENRHMMQIAQGSGLARLYPGVDHATINSVHHQAIHRLSHELTVEARSCDDGIIEAVRGNPAAGYAFATQWHPEWHREDDAKVLPSGPILDEFLAACRTAAKL